MEDNRKPFLVFGVSGHWVLVDATSDSEAKAQVTAYLPSPLTATELGTALARAQLLKLADHRYKGYFVQPLKPPPQTKKTVYMVTAHILVDEISDEMASKRVALHVGKCCDVLEYAMTSEPREIDWPYKKGSL